LEPPDYWTPGLAHWLHLRPADMEHLRVWQLLAAHEFIARATKGR
jgi:hypothetical protein